MPVQVMDLYFGLRLTVWCENVSTVEACKQADLKYDVSSRLPVSNWPQVIGCKEDFVTFVDCDE